MTTLRKHHQTGIRLEFHPGRVDPYCVVDRRAGKALACFETKGRALAEYVDTCNSLRIGQHRLPLWP